MMYIVTTSQDSSCQNIFNCIYLQNRVAFHTNNTEKLALPFNVAFPDYCQQGEIENVDTNGICAKAGKRPWPVR